MAWERKDNAGGAHPLGARFIGPKDLEGLRQIIGYYHSIFEDTFGASFNVILENSRELVCVRGSKSLRDEFDYYKPGDFLKIVHTGKEAITTGELAGKEKHLYEVFVDRQAAPMPEPLTPQEDDPDDDGIPF